MIKIVIKNIAEMLAKQGFLRLMSLLNKWKETCIHFFLCVVHHIVSPKQEFNQTVLFTTSM